MTETMRVQQGVLTTAHSTLPTTQHNTFTGQIGMPPIPAEDSVYCPIPDFEFILFALTEF